MAGETLTDRLARERVRLAATAQREILRLTGGMSQDAALTFLLTLDEVCAMLARFPDSGWPLGKRRRRKAMVGHVHVLTYERIVGGIEVKRVLAVAEAIDRGETPAPIERLSFADVPMLLETLTPQRWRLLEHLKKTGPLSVNGLARQLGRNYKNVHNDVDRLSEVGLVERQEDGRLSVPYGRIVAELKLAV